MSKLTKFLENVGHFAPLVLSVTPLAPIAPAVAAAIAEAEQIKGASGAEKLAHVVNVAERSAQAAQAAGVKVDPAQVRAAAQDVVGAVVAVANVAHAKAA